MKANNRLVANQLSLLLVCASLLAIGLMDPATAETTSQSTIFETARNETTGSTAASASSPGGAVTGTASPGDRIKWVVAYQNNTSGDAAVNLKDSLTDAGAYVGGSLQLPPNPDQAASFGAQFSTDGGGTWQGGSEPAGVNGVGLTGTFPARTQQKSLHPTAPIPVSLNNTGGDGYNAVPSPDGSLVYAVFHHNRFNQHVFCATTTGGLCPGWPVGSNSAGTYVSPVTGTPIGTGANGMVTAWQNGTFLVDGKLHWIAQAVTADGTGKYPAGIMCLDTSTLTSCGFTVLSEMASPPVVSLYPAIAGSGLPASNGNYYFADGEGNLRCFSPSTGACGTTILVATASAYRPVSVTYSNLVFSLVFQPVKSVYGLFCRNVATSTACPGYPVDLPSSFNSSASGHPLGAANVPLPVLDPAGSISGMCLQSSTQTYGCWNMSGQVIASPYALGVTAVSTHTGDAFVMGTRVYAPIDDTNAVGCFDFGVPVVGGQVQRCAGFTPATNPANYTVRAMNSNSTCLLADGDGQLISSFDALSGGACSSTAVSETIAPTQYYCGTGASSFQAWSLLSITGAPPGSYGNVTLSLSDADGSPVAGFQDLVLAPGQPLDISSIPTSSPTSELTASAVFHSATTAVTAAQVSMSWVGNPPETCFETIAPAVGCGQTGTVSNTAVAVTDASAAGGGSDAPVGNATGTTSFTSIPTAAQCSLEFEKTASADPNPVVPGSVVHFTVKVTNTGTMPYTFPQPASFTDDLSDVLADASYNDDASATTGSVTYARPSLSWTAPAMFAPGATAAITYTVRVNSPAAANLRMTNTVVGPVGSNCGTGSNDAACTVVVPITSSLEWNKVDATSAHGKLSGSIWSLQEFDAGGIPLDEPVKITDCVHAPCTGPDTDPAGGQFLLTGLGPEQELQLTEVQAPAGYRLDRTPIPVTISSTKQMNTLADVVNHPLSPGLAVTGGGSMSVLVWSASGLLGVGAVLAAWLTLRRTRRAPRL